MCIHCNYALFQPYVYDSPIIEPIAPWALFPNLPKWISFIYCLLFLHIPTQSNLRGIPGFPHRASSPVTHLSFQNAPEYLWSLFSEPSTDTWTPVPRR